MQFSRVKTSVRYDHPDHLVRIVGDGAIASIHIGDGRLIPLVIVDTTRYPELQEFIRIHKYLAPGDVTSQWGRVEANIGTVALFLKFSRPAELVAVIEFDIFRHGILVEQVLSTNALYIQAGREGDRLKNTWDTPRVMMEIPELEFRRVWDKMFLSSVTKSMRTKGLNRQQSKRAAIQAIESIRGFGQIRLPTK